VSLFGTIRAKIALAKTGVFHLILRQSYRVASRLRAIGTDRGGAGETFIVSGFTKFLLVFVAIVSASAPAHAATFVFDFNGNSSLSGTHGNSRVFIATSGNQTLAVRATAWSISGGKTYNSFLGLYSAGLGATSDDDGTGNKNRHTIDNQVATDFIILQFNSKVDLDSAQFNPFKLYQNNGSSSSTYSYQDNDATIGVGTSTGSWLAAPNLDNKNISLLNSLIPNQFASAGTGSATVRSLNSSNFSGNVWMIGAALPAHNFDGRYDAFKLDLLTVNSIQAVPEPATWLLMLAGFGLVGFALRRHQEGMPAASIA
jgi:PEP-CTERM motif